MKRDAFQFAKETAQMLYEMHTETTSWLYETPDIPEEFINEVVDCKIHATIMKLEIETDILWEISLDPDRFKNKDGEFEYQYWMHDYAYAIDSYIERVYQLKQGEEGTLAQEEFLESLTTKW